MGSKLFISSHLHSKGINNKWVMTRRKVKLLVTESCSTLVAIWTVACQAPLPMEFSRKESGLGSQSLLQGIFPTQGLSPGLLYGRQILYPLSHLGSPIFPLPVVKWVETLGAVGSEGNSTVGNKARGWASGNKARVSGNLGWGKEQGRPRACVRDKGQGQLEPQLGQGTCRGPWETGRQWEAQFCGCCQIIV